MANEPQTPNLGSFRAWILFDAHAVRLLGYVEPPLADQYGTISPFRKPTSYLRPDLVPDLSNAGSDFFDSAIPSGLNTLIDALGNFEDSYLQALRVTAPDFFEWINL